MKCQHSMKCRSCCMCRQSPDSAVNADVQKRRFARFLRAGCQYEITTAPFHSHDTVEGSAWQVMGGTR